MKTAIVAAAILTALTVSPAFAAATQTGQTPEINTIQGSEVGGWTAPGQSSAREKTRAQVRHELIQAEKDGQLAYLNAMLYSHG